MKKALLFSFIVYLYSSVSAQCTSNRYLQPVFATVTVTSDILYGSAVPFASSIPENLFLDIYEPAADTLSMRPLIVYAYGGAFVGGFKTQPPIPTYASYLAQCGYVVASIQYRTGFDLPDGNSATRAVYRGVQDMRGAVRFLCQNYPQYRIDTQAIFLTGSSAGCFSGLHSCFMEQADFPSAIHGTLTEPGDLGCMDCADNTDNNNRMPLIRGIISHWGAIFDTSVIRTTAKDHVPTICLQGDQDPIVPYNSGPPFGYPLFPTVYGSAPIHKRMNDIGLKNELHTFVGYGHEPWLLAPQLIDTCYVYELPFLYSILKPQPITITGDTASCLNDMVSYTATGSMPDSYICWDPGLGGAIVSMGTNSVVIQWVSSGPHMITAREMTRNEVNGDLDSFVVNVVSKPRAAFGDSVAHTDVSFSDSSVWASSWSYSFGDGTTSTLKNPDHYYHSQDTFIVRLIVSNGYCTDTSYRIVVTDTCPAAETITYTISGDTVYFSTDPSAVSYSWRFGDGDTSERSSPYHVYTNSQNYLTSLWATTTAGCTVYGSVIVPFKAVTAGMSEINNGNAIKLYPNPASSQITVSYTGQEAPVSLSIIDMTGRILMSEARRAVNGDNSFSLNTAGLTDGIYLFEMHSEGSAFISKFSISK